jgi:uncharacterized protein Smg (DUF494 family)
MVSEIVEVIVEVFKGIQNEKSLQDIESLFRNGDKYHKNIISAAYSWIHEKSLRDNSPGSEVTPVSEKAFRILSKEEKSLLGEEVEKYLMCLYNIGLLNNNDIDKIVEQALSFPENANNLNNINLLILSLFFDTDKKSLPGSRYILYSSDTVN